MNIADFNKCSNCGACYNICPKGAISVNSAGVFYDPKVNPELCVECGLCAKVCPVNTHFEKKVPIYACAGWHNDEKIVLNSSSGGMFWGLAQQIISEGGVVFGAVYSDDCKTVEFASSDDVPLYKMQKSKYVESTIGNAFRKIKREIEAGRKVLFCGTPCQAAGIAQFLGKSYDNLIICDFACGGLPSHQMYQKHLNGLEKKYRSEVQAVDFRPKTHGWKRYAIRIDFKNGKVYNRLGIEDDYLKSFLNGRYSVRDYCLECKFSDCHTADITIADFWRHDKLSALQNKDGISLILCNSEKGMRTIESLGNQFLFSKLDVEKAAYNYKKTDTSDIKLKKHADFLALYQETDLQTASRRFVPISFAKKIRYCIVRTICRRRKDSK